MVKEDTDGPPDAPNLVAGDIIFFRHIDGMYSSCRYPNGNPCYLKAWAEVEIVPNEVIDKLYP
jgi:hypothetical protein